MIGACDWCGDCGALYEFGSALVCRDCAGINNAAAMIEAATMQLRQHETKKESQNAKE